MSLEARRGWALSRRAVTVLGVAVVAAVVVGLAAGLSQGSAGLGWALGVIVLVVLLVLARIELLHRRVIRRLDSLGKRDATARARQARATAAVLDVASSIEELRKRGAWVTAEQAAGQRQREYAQVQSALWLFTRFRTIAPVAAMRGWAASPDFIELVIGELIRDPPEVLLECGSGVTTLWAALAVDQLALPTRVVSLEHQEQYARRTSRMLADHGVEQHVELRTARLVQVGLEGHTTTWYDPDALADLSEIGLVLVDGPPTSTGPDARLPALPLLYPRLSATARLVLDDADRPEERAVVLRWEREFPDFRSERVDTEKGAVVMRRLAPAAD